MATWQVGLGDGTENHHGRISLGSDFFKIHKGFFFWDFVDGIYWKTKVI